jgi:drug/metabolite transporter (DMT)-like permease
VTPADLVLLTANAVFGTSYVALRLAVDDLGPLTLAVLRLARAPLVLMEWAIGRGPVWTRVGVAAGLYLAIVITGLGYLVWNWALERVSAARAAIFLNLQPLVGALLGSPGWASRRQPSPPRAGLSSSPGSGSL